MTTNVTKDFPFRSELGQVWSMCLLYDRGHTARQHTPTGHIYISQPEQEKVRLLTHATNFLGQHSPRAQHDHLAFRACKSTFSVTQE